MFVLFLFLYFQQWLLQEEIYRKVSEFLFIKQNRSTFDKHGTSVPLKNRTSNNTLNKRTMSRQTYSEPVYRLRWIFLRKRSRISVFDCFGKISVLSVWPILECTCQVNFDVPLLYVLSPIFLISSSVKHLKGSFFCRNIQGISVAGCFQEKAPAQMFDSFMNVCLSSIVMLLYYQYYC